MHEENDISALSGLPFALGELKGRVVAIEQRMTNHEAFVREFSVRVDAKLDEISRKISSEGGQKAATLAIVNGCLIIASPIFAWIMIHLIGLRL